MNRSDAKYFSTSTALHVGLCLLVLSIATTKVPPPPPQEVEIEMIESTQPAGGTPDIIAKGDEGPPCELWYGGIGILGYTTVEQIYEGYPADRAGIQVGDFLITSEGIRGEPGTKLELDVLRNNKRLHFTLIREKICYD